MTLTPTSRLAQVVSGSGLILTLAAVALGYRLDHYGYGGEIVVWYRPLIESVQNLAVLTVGGLIASRQPRNVYGWLWLIIGWGTGVIQPWSSLLASWALSTSPPKWVLGGLAVQMTAIGWLTAISMIPLILLFFPNGRLPSHRWRWLPRALIAAMGVTLLFFWAVPGPSGVAPVDNPFGLAGQFGQIANYITMAAIASILFFILPLAAISLIFRYRRAGALERAQLRWLLFMALVNVFYIAIDSSEIHRPWIPDDVMTDMGGLFLLALPITVAIAVLRYRLFDIDILIRKTLVYTMLTALLALVYFGSVILLQNIFAVVSGQRSTAVIVLSTLLIAALFQPLRSRLQRIIDRRFYRQKVDRQQVMTQFAQTARDGMSMEALQTAVLHVVQESMQPEQASVWLTTQPGTSQIAQSTAALEEGRT